MQPLPAAEQRAVALYRTVSPSVLSLSPTASTSGSAFIWSDTYAITAAHLLPSMPASIRATRADGSPLTLHVAHANPALDLALLRPARPLSLPPALPLAADPVHPGQAVYAVYAAPRAAPRVADGIVAAVDVSAPVIDAEPARLEGLLQLTVPVNKGASGAPLLDSGGCLIGMICAIGSESGRFEGVTYAVPVDILREFARRARAKL